MCVRVALSEFGVCACAFVGVRSLILLRRCIACLRLGLGPQPQPKPGSIGPGSETGYPGAPQAASVANASNACSRQRSFKCGTLARLLFLFPMLLVCTTDCCTCAGTYALCHASFLCLLLGTNGFASFGLAQGTGSCPTMQSTLCCSADVQAGVMLLQ